MGETGQAALQIMVFSAPDGSAGGLGNDKIENRWSGLLERERHLRRSSRASTLNRLGDRQLSFAPAGRESL